MNRIIIVVVRGLIIAAVLLAGSNIPAQTAPLSTPACGTLPGDTTWSISNSPYDVCTSGVIVPVGLTLTIDPGVTVQFELAASNQLIVHGTLAANGTSVQPIVLAGVDVSPGSWGGISAVGSVGARAHVNLNYVTLDDGGASGSSGAQVFADQAWVSINHSLISHSAGNGVFITTNARLDAHTTTFVDNGQNAVQLNQISTDVLMTDLSASGNGTDGIRLSGNSNPPGQIHMAYAGIPYVVDGPLGNTNLGDALTIDPGNTLIFTPSGWLYIRGRLNAIGTVSKPITFTAQTKTPGSWRGLFIDGGIHQAFAQLDYVTIEYGGNSIHGANIEVANGRLIVHHSVIRYSLTDGVRFDTNWGGSILESQIVDNNLYGVVNETPAHPVLATNNWWGDPGGPQSDVAGCSTGLGSKITAGVFYAPALTSANATLPFPLSSAPNITITPRRWYAPADGVTRVYFDITVRDGNGAPLPGRTVHLGTSLGSATDGGITDINGKTLAYLTSNTTGDADVLGLLTTLSCEGYLSPESNVTFTQPINITELMPDEASPYFDGDIGLSPMPIITGINTTITAKLANPLPSPITVDVSFYFAQASIGLVFGPIKDLVGQVIPANSSVTLSADFMPVVSGHYCVQVTYTITAIGTASVLAPLGIPQVKQKNFFAQQGSLGQPSGKETLARADKAFKTVSKIPAGQTQVQKAVLGQWWSWMKSTIGDITTAEGLDPPRQDYNQVTLPVRYPIPTVQPDANISIPRAAAMNAINAALTDVTAYGSAATTAMDRYGGATEDNNLQWASEQANELLYYNTQFATALLSYADQVDAFVLLLKSEGETQITVSPGDITAYQTRLESQGFSAQEISDAKLVGWTDAMIETYRQGIIAANPNDVAGNLLDILTNDAAISRELGNILLHPPIFNPPFSVSGGAGHSPNAAGNTMAQVYNSVTTIQIANPSALAAQIDISVRRIDLPADWTVDVSPPHANLLPGQQATVMVSIIAGSPVPQRSLPSIAVEGKIGSQLLGGVVIAVMVPNFTGFDGHLRVYLPLLRK